MSGRNLSILAVALALGAVGLAHGQTSPPAAPPAAGARAWGPGQAGPMAEHMKMRREARLKALHDVLGVRPDQEAAFRTFADSMMPEPMNEHPDQVGMMGDRMMNSPMTMPERLDMMSRMIDERMSRMKAHFQRHADAIRAFYAVLSPDQKRVFDALPGLMGRGGMAQGGMGMWAHGAGMGMGPHGGPDMDGPGDRY